MPTVAPKDGAKVGSGCGKEGVATTEEERVIGIPPVVRLRPIVVQPETVVIAFAVEDVRVPVGIGSVQCAIQGTACLKEEQAVSYLRSKIAEHTAPSLSFLKEQHTNPLEKVTWPESVEG